MEPKTPGPDRLRLPSPAKQAYSILGLICHFPPFYDCAKRILKLVFFSYFYNSHILKLLDSRKEEKVFYSSHFIKPQKCPRLLFFFRTLWGVWGGGWIRNSVNPWLHEFSDFSRKNFFDPHNETFFYFQYSVQRRTSNLRVNYYVKESFHQVLWMILVLQKLDALNSLDSNSHWQVLIPLWSKYMIRGNNVGKRRKYENKIRGKLCFYFPPICMAKYQKEVAGRIIICRKIYILKKIYYLKNASMV